MYKGILHTHYLVVTLFLLIYVIKTILLLSDKNDLLARFTRLTKVAEMIISAMFLITGVYLMTQQPSISALIWVKLILVFGSIPIAIIGFKKSNKILAALSLVMITASFGLAEISHKKKMKAADTSAIAANDGKALYEATCKVCHGSDGKAGLAGAKDLSATALDIAGIKNVILHGQATMPAADVTGQQADAIAAYVDGNLKGH